MKQENANNNHKDSLIGFAKLRVIAGFGLVGILLGAVFFISFQSILNLSNSVEDATKPNNTLLKMDDLMQTVYHSERIVRAYTLTGDKAYLGELKRLEGAFFGITKKLRSTKSDQEHLRKSLRLEKLLSEKISIVDSIVRLKQEQNKEKFRQRVVNERIRSKLKTTAQVKKIKVIEPQQQKNGTLSRPMKNENKVIDDSKKKAPIDQANTEIHNKIAALENLLNLKGRQADESDSSQQFLNKVITNVSSVERVADEIVEKPDYEEVEKAEDQNKQESKKLNTSHLSLLNDFSFERPDSAASLTLSALIRKDFLLMLDLEQLVNKMKLEERNLKTLSNEKSLVELDATWRKVKVLCILGCLVIFMFIALIIRDIQNSKTLNLSLIKARDFERRNAKAKQDFLSYMSHEIRTPMNSIIGFSERLEKESLSGNQKNYLSRIITSSNHLLNVINDILDLGKLDSQKVELSHAPISIFEVLRNITDSMQILSNANGTEIICEVDEVVQKSIYLGDAYRIHQVLLNLVSNAVKFTADGVIKISCHLQEDEDFKHVLLIDVSDSGVGILGENIDKIFDPYEQAKNQVKKSEKGTGLGLSITKKLVELMGGSIAVKSKVNEGTTFSLRLSLQTSTERPEMNMVQKKPIGNQSLQGQEILFVDDDEYNRELADLILKEVGANVTLAVNGEDAVKLVNTKTIDLIIMDLHMPQMNGDETVRLMKAQGVKIPVILATANLLSSAELKRYDTLFDAFITKPFKASDLLDKIIGLSSFASKSTFSDKLASANIEIKEVVNKYIDISKLKLNAVDNQQFIVKMLKIFYRQGKENLVLFHDAKLRRDKKMLQRVAHKFVASCRHLGILELTTILSRIEQDANEFKDADLDRMVEELLKHIESVLLEVEQLIEHHDKAA